MRHLGERTIDDEGSRTYSQSRDQYQRPLQDVPANYSRDVWGVNAIGALSGMERTEKLTVDRIVSRRAVVRAGLRVAYAAPLISASYSLSSLEAAAKDARVSEDEAAKLIDGRNSSPVAIPGEGFEVEDTDGDGFETVTVDGSSSADPDGTITSYTWSLGKNVVAEGVVATIQLPVGTHRLVLTVTDDKGESNSAKIRIRVKRGAAAEAQPTEESAPDQPEPTQAVEPDPNLQTAELPPPPYDVEAKQKNAEIAITWKVEPSVQPPYRIYRTLDDGLQHTDEEIDKFDWQLIREEWEKLSYRDADIQIGVAYLYIVRSFDGTNESERSNIAAITPQAIAEEPPVDTPTPEVAEEPPTATVEVIPDTPTPEPTEVVENTPTEPPPPPTEPPAEETQAEPTVEGDA